MSETLEYDNGRVYGPIEIDDMEQICRHHTYSQFQLYISNATYAEVSQVREELVMRENRISIQLGNRVNFSEVWRINANKARDIIRNKLKMVQTRIDSIRNDNISLLMSRYGGIKGVGGNRLACIRMLLNIIDRNSRVTFSPEEISIIDLCRQLGKVSEETVFNGLSFDPVLSSVNFSDGTEIARINSNVFMSEEYGFRFAATDDMRRILDRSEQMSDYLCSNTSCKTDNGHVSTRCVHCQAEKLREDIVALMSRLR